MARVTLTLDFPTLTKDDLVALVVANDDAASSVNGEPGITPEHVRGDHVVALWVTGDLPDVPCEVYATLQE
jgi:hypothetical protein